jgi:hypothetical protein
MLAARQFLFGAQTLPLLESGFEVLADVLDAFNRPLAIFISLVFHAGQLGLLGEGHDIADIDLQRFQIIADAQQFADGDGRARDGFASFDLAALDALGDRDFALARQKRDDAHLAQVQAHRIVRLVEHARRQIEINFVFV